MHIGMLTARLTQHLLVTLSPVLVVVAAVVLSIPSYFLYFLSSAFFFLFFLCFSYMRNSVVHKVCQLESAGCTKCTY